MVAPLIPIILILGAAVFLFGTSPGQAILDRTPLAEMNPIKSIDEEFIKAVGPKIHSKIDQVIDTFGNVIKHGASKADLDGNNPLKTTGEEIDNVIDAGRVVYLHDR